MFLVKGSMKVDVPKKDVENWFSRGWKRADKVESGKEVVKVSRKGFFSTLFKRV